MEKPVKRRLHMVPNAKSWQYHGQLTAVRPWPSGPGASEYGAPPTVEYLHSPVMVDNRDGSISIAA